MPKNYVSEICPCCGKRLTKLYFEYKDWSGEIAYSEKFIRVCLNDDCLLKSNYDRLGHWKKEPENYKHKSLSKKEVKRLSFIK